MYRKKHSNKFLLSLLIGSSVAVSISGSVQYHYRQEIEQQKKLFSLKQELFPQITEFYLTKIELQPLTELIEDSTESITAKIPNDKWKPIIDTWKPIIDTLIRPEDVTAVGVHVLRKCLLSFPKLEDENLSITDDLKVILKAAGTAYARNKGTQASVALLEKAGYESGETTEMVIQTLMGAVVIPAIINLISKNKCAHITVQ